MTRPLGAVRLFTQKEAAREVKQYLSGIESAAIELLRCVAAPCVPRR